MSGLALHYLTRIYRHEVVEMFIKILWRRINKVLTKLKQNKPPCSLHQMTSRGFITYWVAGGHAIRLSVIRLFRHQISFLPG